MSMRSLGYHRPVLLSSAFIGYATDSFTVGVDRGNLSREAKKMFVLK